MFNTTIRGNGANKTVRLLASLLIACAAIVGCGEKKNEPITIGYSDWPGWVAWEIAIEKGMFEKKGVAVEFRWFDNYVESLSSPVYWVRSLDILPIVAILAILSA
ncbi:MAG: hypothetical protein RIF32_07035 [Leptospirales bacterium]